MRRFGLVFCRRSCGKNANRLDQPLASLLGHDLGHLGGGARLPRRRRDAAAYPCADTKLLRMSFVRMTRCSGSVGEGAKPYFS